MKPKPAIGTSNGLALVGVAMLGWGLAMVLGVMPHEDRIVGAGLAVFGAAVLATRPRLPRVPRVPAPLIAALGATILLVVLGHAVLFAAPLDGPKVALALLGTALVAASPFLRVPVRLPIRGRPTVPLGGLVVGTLVALGTPLGVWAFQAAFKRVMGHTPIDAFVSFALLPPVGAVLHLLGLDPGFSGHTITYTTLQGPLSVDVGAACSGVQAMAVFGAVLALFLFAERPGGRQLAIWSLVGIGGVYVANLVRMTTLLLVGYGWGPDALVQVHAQAGWVFFVAWALLFAWLARSRASRAPRAGRIAAR